jgi:hypothetical protein
MTPRTPGAPVVPHSPSDIDADWLTSVLSSRYPDVEVASATLREVTNGTCSRVRVTAEYAHSGGSTLPSNDLPPNDLFVKTCFDENAFVEMHRSTGRLRNEWRFYEEIAPGIEVPTPALHGSAADRDKERYVFVLDDLRSLGATWGHASTPLEPAVAEIVLAHAARLHAQYWDTEGAKAATGRSQAPWGVREHLVEWIRDGIPRLLDGAAGDVPANMRDPARLERSFAAIVAYLARSPRTMLHGDLHPGNLAFFAPTDPVFTDWAIPRGRWSYDVSYFVVSALSALDRQRCEQDLVRGYLEQLSTAGVDAPTFDEAWVEYRALAFHGLMEWLPVPPHMQSAEVVDIYTARQLVACEELDSLAAIDALC